MRRNKVKQRWRNDEPSVGSWLSLNSSMSAELMAHVGFDWLVVDMEHNAIDLNDTLALFHAICTTDTVPMVRVPWNDPQIIKRALDIGAYGVVIPNVKSREEAEQAVNACRYPPLGARGVGTLRGRLYGGPDYFVHANEEIAVIVMIEDAEAVRKVDEILSVPGVDCAFIGPNDLAASLGVPLGLDNRHPDHVAAVQQVLAAGRRLGVPVGIHCTGAEEVSRRIKEGFLWLALASDAGLLSGAANAAFASLNLPSLKAASAEAKTKGIVE